MSLKQWAIVIAVGLAIQASLGIYASRQAYWHGYNHGAAMAACFAYGPSPCTYKYNGVDYTIPNIK